MEDTTRTTALTAAPVLVRCPNGMTTWHASTADAETFADYGHCCAAASAHQIRDHRDPRLTDSGWTAYELAMGLDN